MSVESSIDKWKDISYRGASLAYQLMQRNILVIMQHNITRFYVE